MLNKLLTILLVFVMNCSFAQTATVHFEFSHIPKTTNRLMVYDQLGVYQNLDDQTTTLYPDDAGNETYKLVLKRPQFLKLGFVLNESDSRYIPYVLFLSPGDDIICHVDFSKKNHEISVDGKGSMDNQPSIQKLYFIDLNEFCRDTLPYHALNAIIEQKGQLDNILSNYIIQFHPSAAFIKANQINVKYFAPTVYYEFKENNVNYKRDAYYRNESVWDSEQKKLFDQIQLNNESALYTFNYIQLITAFSHREKERQWRLNSADLLEFNKLWYPGYNSDNLKFETEQDNLFAIKVIDHYFDGKCAEFLTCDVIKLQLLRHNYKNIDSLFADFKKKYPESPYVPIFNSTIIAYRAK